MEQTQPSQLTPAQAADVIRHYNDFENQRLRDNGWYYRQGVGKSAVHATQANRSILPDGQPLLTIKEAKQGLVYLEQAEVEQPLAS